MQNDLRIPVRDEASRRSRLLFACFLAFVGVYTTVFSWMMARGSSPWVVGDWLVNYSGGFVRRGLMGSLILLLERVSHVPAHWIVFGTQTVLLVVFLVSVERLARRVRWTYLMAAILLGPATIAFTVQDSYAGLRKEILLFAGLAWALQVIAEGRWRDWQMSAMLTVLAVVLVLSHEALVVGTPYLFAALVIQTGDWKRSLKISLLPAVFGAAALVAVALHTGNQAQALAVCTAVGGTLPPYGGDAPAVGSPGICTGSIWWLGLTGREARAIFVPVVQQTHMVRRFAVLCSLAWVPMFVQMGLFYWRDKMRREMQVMFWCCVLSLIGTAGLFYTALDWGRWVHMQALCLMLMIVMVDGRGPRRVATAREGSGALVWRAMAFAAVFVYATLWTLPSIGVYPIGHGYVETIRMLRHMS